MRSSPASVWLVRSRDLGLDEPWFRGCARPRPGHDGAALAGGSLPLSWEEVEPCLPCSSLGSPTCFRHAAFPGAVCCVWKTVTPNNRNSRTLVHAHPALLPRGLLGRWGCRHVLPSLDPQRLTHPMLWARVSCTACVKGRPYPATSVRAAPHPPPWGWKTFGA